jgi:hypothetical protein
MLKTPMLIQACIPNRVANGIDGTIQLLMEALKTQSEWILISKMISANKTKSKLLSTWLYEMMDHSSAKKGIITTIGQSSLQRLSTNNSQLRNTSHCYQVELITPWDT